jgi:hypothetical protein
LGHETKPKKGKINEEVIGSDGDFLTDARAENKRTKIGEDLSGNSTTSRKQSRRQGVSCSDWQKETRREELAWDLTGARFAGMVTGARRRTAVAKYSTLGKSVTPVDRNWWGKSEQNKDRASRDMKATWCQTKKSPSAPSRKSKDGQHLQPEKSMRK